jgi:predicted RNase H-like nuclease (RuvC/YqgF family)
MSEAKRPPLVDNQGAQTGEQSYGNVAGRDITYSGIPIEALMQRLDAEITFRDGIVGALQQERKELHARLNRWEQDQDLYRELDRDNREKRQRALDSELARQRNELEKHRNDLAALRIEQRRGRRVLLWFGAAIVVALIVAGLLVWDRYTALGLAHLWLGSGAAFAFHLWRGAR